MSVVLEPMSAADYQVWIGPQRDGYAEDKVRAGNWPAAGAAERAQRETDEMLPQGVATPGHLFFNVKDGGRAVGTLWVKTGVPIQGSDAFIYNIEVHEDQRGRGYGSAALQELEAMLRAAGAARLGLHVFGFNDAAQRLYARLGFQITNINMTKILL